MNQINLVSAITKELERQKAFFDVKVLNKVVDCANQIIAEVERKRIYAEGKMTFDDWTRSDDTGLSSEWLALSLRGYTDNNVSYPYDPSDFGRCYRMLNCVDGAKDLFLAKADHIAYKSKVWAKYIEHWKELESLWEEESPNGKCPKLYALMQKLQKAAV